MTKEQLRQIELIKKIHPDLSQAKTYREEEFYFACLVMKINYKKYLEKKYLAGGKKKFADSLKWFFSIYKDEIKANSDYFVLDDDEPIIAHCIESGEEILCNNIQQACEIGHCCEKSVKDIIAKRKAYCKGWTYRLASLTEEEDDTPLEDLEEEWRDVVGYEGIYKVSNTGKVKSLNYRGLGKEQILKMGFNHEGNGIFGLKKKNEKLKTYMASRLVAGAFIPNPSNLKYVRFHDSNKSNIRVDNLYWSCHQRSLEI